MPAQSSFFVNDVPGVEGPLAVSSPKEAAYITSVLRAIDQPLLEGTLLLDTLGGRVGKAALDEFRDIAQKGNATLEAVGLHVRPHVDDKESARSLKRVSFSLELPATNQPATVGETTTRSPLPGDTDSPALAAPLTPERKGDTEQDEITDLWDSIVQKRGTALSQLDKLLETAEQRNTQNKLSKSEMIRIYYGRLTMDFLNDLIKRKLLKPVRKSLKGPAPYFSNMSGAIAGFLGDHLGELEEQLGHPLTPQDVQRIEAACNKVLEDRLNKKVPQKRG